MKQRKLKIGEKTFGGKKRLVAKKIERQEVLFEPSIAYHSDENDNVVEYFEIYDDDYLLNIARHSSSLDRRTGALEEYTSRQETEDTSAEEDTVAQRQSELTEQLQVQRERLQTRRQEIIREAESERLNSSNRWDANKIAYYACMLLFFGFIVLAVFGNR